ncbi:MAG: transposase [Phycisphaeraceae bacterium]|nr:transposase [Phycisphaeraceae bacterium]MCW5763005.1 transposase [Phycisphaeraceae bacterium]
MSPRAHRTRFENLNHARFITCSCFQRQRFLDRDRSRRWFVEALERARTLHGFDLWAWVIMPEHFHLLLFPRPGGPPMGSILLSIKQSTARRALKWTRTNRPDALHVVEDRRPDGSVAHRFWQRGGGYDRNVWSDRDIWEKINYIHTNPVARGLCARPEDWPWSSARSFRDPEAGPIRMDRVRILSRP